MEHESISKLELLEQCQKQGAACRETILARREEKEALEKQLRQLHDEARKTAEEVASIKAKADWAAGNAEHLLHLIRSEERRHGALAAEHGRLSAEFRSRCEALEKRRCEDAAEAMGQARRLIAEQASYRESCEAHFDSARDAAVGLAVLEREPT